MPRTVKEAEHTAKRGEILDAAQGLIYTKGYERMTIQDILDALGISKGAFYHYFDSKPAVLEALTERGQDEVQGRLIELAEAPDISAVDKLQRYFVMLNQSRLAHQRDVLTYLRVWYTDDNAIVRQKIDAATIQRRAPLLDDIIRQGIREGVFTLAHPDHAGQIILSLLQSMSHAHAHLMLTLDQQPDARDLIDKVVSTYTAYMDSIERVLGAPTNVLFRIDAAAVEVWVKALQTNH